MHWQRLLAPTALFVALTAMAVWQWDEYRHECQLARETVSSAADSVMNALVGGMRSHRRLGQFFAENIQSVFNGLAQAQDVLAVALVSEDGKELLAAGDTKRLDLRTPLRSGEQWNKAGLQVVKEFRLPAETSGSGGGRGWGRRWQEEETPGAFTPGKLVAAILLFDRQRADHACRHAAWLRGSIVIAGSLVVVCVAMVWRATVRLAEARGRARSFEMEARHFRDLSQAAAGLAHETRNPLGLIRGWTQRLADTGIDSREGRHQAQAVIEECDRVTARINQFLAFARPSEPRPQRFDPADVVQELAVILDPDLNAKRVTLNRMAPGTMILADRERLREALFNLLQNAIQASPEGATVDTRIVEQRDAAWRIEVADCGPGVAAEAVGRLFTPYFTTRADGSGLGLAIVRRIAAAHGWEAGYMPRTGGGAVFWLGGIHG